MTMSMTNIPYYQVDAFADCPFAGNQAAVMPLDTWLPDATLQAIGEENNFAETAFIVQDASGEADYELRWFTPTVEVRMCGHATLASGYVVLSQNPNMDRVTFRTRKAGILEVKRTKLADGSDGFAVALPLVPTNEIDFPAAIAAIGGKPSLIRGNENEYYMLRYQTAEEILALRPDMKALALCGNDLFVATAPGAGSKFGTDVISRVFVPGAGIEEDPVTGSAHAVLAAYWPGEFGQDTFTAYQASARGGYIGCKVDGDRVWLSGQCFMVLTGTFHLV
jgi:PhzF family phenazine biosynthesis protein